MNKLRAWAGLFAVLFSLILGGCSGDSPWRYNPGIPATPTGLTATAGTTSGQVFLSWNSAQGAAVYNVYYSTSPADLKSGAKIANLSGTSRIVTGLTDNVTYYFAMTAVNSSGESPLSDIAATVPVAPSTFQQSDLQGSWYFNALQSGAGARWMKGAVAIDAAGNVTVSSFADSAGNTAAPGGLFNALTILPDGIVQQLQGDFHAVLSANQFRDLLVGTVTVGGSPVMLVMQKRVPGITFTSSDIKGTGRLVAGPLPYVYHQIASGVGQEWQVGSCQVGQDQSVTWLTIDAPSNPQLPGEGNKAVTLSITPDGLVSETPIAGVLPQPTALFANQVMSADKMTIVGTATDASGAYVLRVIQLIHPPSQVATAADYTASKLAGPYVFHDLDGGSLSSWAYGDLTVSLTGSVSIASYLDSTGSSTVPSPITIAMDGQGGIINAADPSYRGQLSYFNDMMVATKTDAGGNYRLSLALKR